MRLRSFFPVMLLLLLPVAACTGDSTGPESSIAGTYTLRSINGVNLPFVIAQTGANKLELVNETIVVAEAGTFTQQGTLRETVNGVATVGSYADAGIYERNGTAVTFQFQSNGSIGSGTASNGVVTVAASGYSYIYRK